MDRFPSFLLFLGLIIAMEKY